MLQDKGLTQTQIANSIGRHQSNISAFANGKSGLKRPSYDVIQGLKKLLLEHGLSEPT